MGRGGGGRGDGQRLGEAAIRGPGQRRCPLSLYPRLRGLTQGLSPRATGRGAGQCLGRSWPSPGGHAGLTHLVRSRELLDVSYCAQTGPSRAPCQAAEAAWAQGSGHMLAGPRGPGAAALPAGGDLRAEDVASRAAGTVARGERKDSLGLPGVASEGLWGVGAGAGQGRPGGPGLGEGRGHTGPSGSAPTSLQVAPAGRAEGGGRGEAP